MATFVFFLVWYVFFIIAFGLGFYILLHKKPKDATTITSKNTASVCAKEDDYEFAGNQMLVARAFVAGKVFQFIKDKSINCPVKLQWIKRRIDISRVKIIYM